MRFNCHTHIFNAKSVFNKYTLDILVNRLLKMNLPDVIKDETPKQLKKIFEDNRGYADEKKLLKSLLDRLTASDEFRDMLKSLPTNNRLSVELDDSGATKKYTGEKIVDLFRHVSELFDRANQDAAASDLMDLISFLRIAFQPDIRHVTDHLIEQLSEEDAVIALMMDITKDGNDNGQFAKQLKDTSEMIVSFPGRLFPFVAVNPLRPDHYSIMEHALTSLGFVGVKLYPSLGYDINSEKMKRVYTYCMQNRVPLLQHCNREGFNYHDDVEKSDPVYWKSVLQEFKELKICFGHFGGGENLCHEIIPPESWTQKILKLMEKYKGVYADISFHSHPMKDETSRNNYFRNLSELIADERYQNRILFGTDYYMVRLRLKEKNYWRYFKEHFTHGEFKQITETNPPDYLGLSTRNREPDWNIDNYIRFIRKHRDKLISDHASWIDKLL